MATFSKISEGTTGGTGAGAQPGQFTQADRNEWIAMKMVEEYK